MKTKHLFQFCAAILLFGTALPASAAETGSFARITLVRIEKTNVVVEVEASADFTKVTLESSPRLGRRAWEPRGVKVLSATQTAGSTITFTVPISPAIEILRVRGDLAENTLPAQFYTGTNDFTLANNGGAVAGGPGVFDGNAGPTSAPGRDAGENVAPGRSVVESDIWK